MSDIPVYPVNVIAKSFAKAKISKTTSMQISYIESAAYFTRMVRKIEQDNIDIKFKIVPWDIDIAHTSYSIGAIFLSVAFLESVLYDTKANFLSNKNNDHKKIDEVKNINWYSGSILERYKKFVSIFKKPAFNEKGKIYNNAKYLIFLRNELTHYESKLSSRDDNCLDVYDKRYGEQDTDRINKLVKYLRDEKFSLNPFYQNCNFPREYLGYGCSKWSFDSSKIFVDEFFTKMEITGLYNQNKDRLKTE